MKAPPKVPVQIKRSESFILNNSGLSPEQYFAIKESLYNDIRIKYSGGFENLAYLLRQLSTIKSKYITLSIDQVTVNKNIYLPFEILNDNVKICFADQPELQSNFNAYIINYCVPFSAFVKHVDEKIANRLIIERGIQNEFVNDLSEKIISKGRRLEDYSKEDYMNVVFNYVKKTFPYDIGLVGRNGEATIQSSLLGCTAYQTYTRGKGVCEGRSKLIKLLANNPTLEVPCYLVSGHHGNLEHMWNEFINESGQIIEYDASFGTKVMMSRLPSIYKIEKHEPEVRRLLK